MRVSSLALLDRSLASPAEHRAATRYVLHGAGFCPQLKCCLSNLTLREPLRPALKGSDRQDISGVEWETELRRVRQ
jgi:hypothetical protein